MIRTIPRAAALVGALTLGLTGCGEASTPGSTPTPTDVATATGPAQTSIPDESTSAPSTSEDEMKTPRPVPLPSTGQPDLPTGPVPQAVLDRPDVQAAVADYAKRMDVAVDDVKVVGFAEVTWSDGSLGCPQPGMMYTQALVPGYQLVLRAAGRTASYHAAKDKAFSYCANPKSPVGSGSSTR
ncbi:hypothetical protein [Ornithinimicrobium avium]|uniref:PASTA domain-containing protein n=1 Tax=Ornithinimicrobium avium TaxID=2283195 RepID=A0A345NMV0_9MICO|nr:hypothetical protein [Ornithinimicrobium avium]AXH96358.1 hypothetical protein DV701_09710 [Ornithinimicrobium avium]